MNNKEKENRAKGGKKKNKQKNSKLIPWAQLFKAPGLAKNLYR